VGRAGQVQGLAERVASVVVDLSGQGQYVDTVGGGGHDGQLLRLDSLFGVRHFSSAMSVILAQPGLHPESAAPYVSGDARVRRR